MASTSSPSPITFPLATDSRPTWTSARRSPSSTGLIACPMALCVLGQVGEDTCPLSIEGNREFCMWQVLAGGMGEKMSSLQSVRRREGEISGKFPSRLELERAHAKAREVPHQTGDSIVK